LLLGEGCAGREDQADQQGSAPQARSSSMCHETKSLVDVGKVGWLPDSHIRGLTLQVAGYDLANFCEQ